MFSSKRLRRYIEKQALGGALGDQMNIHGSGVANKYYRQLASPQRTNTKAQQFVPRHFHKLPAQATSTYGGGLKAKIL